MTYKEGERKINKLAQRIFRNIKVYDHLIKFIVDNKKLLIHVRTVDKSKFDGEKINLYEKIQRVFRRSFHVLEGITLFNKTNQELLWKYKEVFTFPELGNTKQDGELEFVLAIVDKNKRIATERSLSTFISSLNQRAGHKDNFVKLLDIYHELMDYEHLGTIKKSLIQMILEQPEIVQSYTQNTRQEFEASINLKEILLHIIVTQDMRYCHKSLLKIFPINDFIEKIDKSLVNLNSFTQNDNDYDEQDYEELRESQQQVITDIYEKLYLDKSVETYDIDQIYNLFNDTFAPAYEEKLSYFLLNVDIHDTSSYRISELKLVIINFQIFMKSIKTCLEGALDRQLSGKGINRNLPMMISRTSDIVSKIDALVEELIVKLKTVKDDKIKEFLLNFSDDAEEVEVENEEEGKNSMTNNLKSPRHKDDDTSPNGNHGGISNELFKILQSAKDNLKTNQIISKINKIKIKDRRSQESIGWGKTWGEFVKEITNSRSILNILDEEQNTCSSLIYNTLTMKTIKNEDVLNSFSMRTFLSNSLDYICECEKEAWTVYISIFTFKIFSNILKLSATDLENSESINKYKVAKIHKYILNTFDTLKNANLLFTVLSENKDNNLFKDEIFMAASYFTNKLFAVRLNSMQIKFEGLFLNHTGSQSFFKRIDQYLKIYSSKIKTGLLRDHLSKIKYTDELSEKAYYVDKNLEKQIVNMFMYLWKNGNTFMQNYMKKQTNHSRSFNMVFSINEFAKVFNDHLQYSVAFDTFYSCLQCLLEFIQGPNRTNQNVLIANDFVSLANGMLMMKYHDNDKVSQENKSLERYFNYGPANSSKIAPRVNNSMQVSMSNKESMTFGTLFSKRFTQLNFFTKPSSNYMISLAKYQVLMILNSLLDGFEPTDYVYYLCRREIDPMTLRRNFAYQHYFLTKFHKSEYKTNLFFNYADNINKDSKSPFIIEVGFLLYFLIKKMEKNLKIDEDERYNNHIIQLLPTDESEDVKIGFISSTFNLIKNLFKLIFKVCRKKASKIKDKDIDNIQNSSSEISNIFRFYERYSSRIEILKNNKLFEKYFIKLPYCVFNTHESKNEFLDSVNRTNCKTKCENLMWNSKLLMIALKLDYTLRHSFGSVIGFIIQQLQFWRNALTVLAFTINIIIILAYNEDLGNREYKPSIGSLNDSETKMLLYVLGAINLLLVLFIVISQLFIRIPYNYQKYKMMRESVVDDSSILFLPDIKALKRSKELIIKAYDIGYMMASDLTIPYHILLLVFSILGLALHPFFYAFMLTYVMTRSIILIKVVRAVYVPIREIMWTLILLVIITYFFAIIAFTEFHSDFNSQLDGACYSLWTCLMVSLDVTYKYDGSVGGFLSPPFTASSSQDVDIDWARFFYDYLFNIVIAVLVFEILSGIIIDKFSELREQQEEKDEDSKSEWFICGQSREELEKKLGYEGFYIHTNYDHNLWDYLFFIAYLRHKKVSLASDFSEIERFVYRKLNDDDITWMPCYYDYEAQEDEVQENFQEEMRVAMQQVMIDLKEMKMRADQAE